MPNTQVSSKRFAQTGADNSTEPPASDTPDDLQMRLRQYALNTLDNVTPEDEMARRKSTLCN